MTKLHSTAEIDSSRFSSINRGYDSVFQNGKMSIGLVAPIESYPVGSTPSLAEPIKRIQLAEKLGFTAIWLRDVPFDVPSFGDAGQVFDPFVYLGLLAGQTDNIALGVASIVLPLRHPAHVAKAAATADVLSAGRLIMGVASGDRPDEYPALNLPFENRGQRFRDGFAYIREMADHRPEFENQYGSLDQQLDMLPKPIAGKIPILITGGSQQSPEWLANHGDGWMLYPRSAEIQNQIISKWRSQVTAAGRPPQPVMQALYIDLLDNRKAGPTPIHLGFQCGIDYLSTHLRELQQAGVNHVALNLRFNQAPIEATLEHLAEELVPTFHSN